MKKNTLAAFNVFIIFSVLGIACALADTVYVTDGRMIRGNIVEENEDFVTIFETDSLWNVAVPKKLIRSISRSSKPRGAPKAKNEPAPSVTQPQAAEPVGQMPQLIEEEFYEEDDAGLAQDDQPQASPEQQP